MRKLLLALLLVGMLVLVPVHASAARPAPIGDRIRVYVGGRLRPSPNMSRSTSGMVGNRTQPMGTPLCLFSFELEVDGQPVEADFVLTYRHEEDPLPVRQRVHNFPGGMAGIHKFTGHWFAPCQSAVDARPYEGPCLHPGERVEAWTTLVMVEFEQRAIPGASLSSCGSSRTCWAAPPAARRVRSTAWCGTSRQVNSSFTPGDECPGVLRKERRVSSRDEVRRGPIGGRREGDISAWSRRGKAEIGVSFISKGCIR